MNNNYKKVPFKMYDYRCDIKLNVEKETFRAHRDVLAEASDYFSAMFSHNMVEKEKDAIELKGISPRGFRAMMDYFYHGHVTVEPANVEDVLEAARFFHIEWLIAVCREFLVKRLSMDNYLWALQLADRYCLGDLHTDIFKFVAYNFSELAVQPVFMELSYELLFALLSEDHYIDAPEGHIFKVVCRWLDSDAEQRKQYSASLLTLIRYPLLDKEELESISEVILEIPEVKECIDEAIKYNANPTKQCLLDSDNTHVRGSRDTLVLFSAVDDANMIQYKAPGCDGFFSQKVDTSFMQSVFEFASVSVLGDFLFVAGGYNRGTWCSSPAFYSYNPRNRLWAQLSSMKQPRVSFSLCSANQGLYAVTGIEHIVLDGIDREIILESVEFYDPMTNLWHFIPELPIACFSAAACVVDEKLYVSGGISADPEDTVPVSYHHVYIPKEQIWIPKSRMLTEHQGHGMICHQNKLYVFGGYTAGEDTISFVDCHKCEMYDIDLDQWTRIADSPKEYLHFSNSLTLQDDKVYILGGKASLRTLHTYDPETNDFTNVEVYGPDVQKIVRLKVALPLDLM